MPRRRMGETIRTLNGVFRDMQADNEGVSKADLKHKNRLLQQELKELQDECAQLREAKAKAARVPVLEKTIKSLQKEGTSLKVQLQEREQLVARLQEREAERLREEEVAKAKAPGHEGELSTKERDGEEEDAPAVDGDGVPDPLANVLCIKCKKSLSDMANIQEAVEGEPPEPPRLVCHGYRVLLPNIDGERPPRPPNWVRRCMRAIVDAILKDHAAHGPHQEGRSRFPEFAYSFFEPPRGYLDGLSAADRRQVIGEADDDRWGMYYGVKLLSRESDEAKLFWSLLDESHGVDFLAFYLYCLEIIQTTCGASLRAQGAADATTHFGLKEFVAKGEAEAVRRKEVGANPADSPWIQLVANGDADALALGGQQCVWIPLVHAVEATEKILLKANPKLRASALEATRDIAVEATGRSQKWGAKQLECVDLALWLRVLTHLYREEQAHRRAAVRLMFETALAGTIAAHAPDYGEGRAPAGIDDEDPDPHAPPPCVDLPQFVAIVRTLYPGASTVDACALYRDAHEASKGRVDYQVFLETCERGRFFARALALPHHARAAADFPLPEKDRRALGAVVHVRERMMTPLFDRVDASLPDHARARFRALRHQFAAAVEVAEENVGGSSEVDGMRPLAAYRRLLQIGLEHRLRSYELGADYPEGSGGAGGFGTRLLRKTMTPGDFVMAMLRELRSLELVLIDFHEPTSWTMVQRLQTTLAVSRVQKVWGKRQARERGAPQAVRLRMRKGYMSGRGEIKLREVRRAPADTLARVGLVWEAWYAIAGDDAPFADAVRGPGGIPRFCSGLEDDVSRRCKNDRERSSIHAGGRDSAEYPRGARGGAATHLR